LITGLRLKCFNLSTSLNVYMALLYKFRKYYGDRISAELFSLVPDNQHWNICTDGHNTLTAITVLVLRDIVCKVHIKLFNLGEAEVLRSTQRTTRLTSY